MAIGAPRKPTFLGLTEGAAVIVTLHLHPGRLHEVVLFQVATIRDVMPLAEYTVEVVRERPLAEFVNAG